MFGGLNIIYNALYNVYLSEEDIEWVKNTSWYMSIILIVLMLITTYWASEDGLLSWSALWSLLWAILLFFSMKIYMQAGISSGLALYNLS